MKQCRKCLIDKPLEEFSTRTRSKDGKHSYCRSCVKDMMAVIYNKNPLKIKARNDKIRNKLKSLVNEIKLNQSCPICQESEVECLDFHHVNPTDKDVEIPQLIGMKNETRLLQEIKKCVLICSNCHRKIHSDKLEVFFSFG